jgi:hypothetical protein
MATVDTVRQIGAKLEAARKRVPEIKPAIQTKQARAKAEEGRRDLARLDKDLEEGGKLVSALEKELAPVGPVDPVDPIEPPPVIPGPWPDVLPKPPDPSQVLSGKTFTGSGSGDFLQLAGKKNFLVTKNKFVDSNRRILKGDAGRGVLLFDNFIDKLHNDGIHGGICIYPGTNWQTSKDVYELFCVGLEFGPNNQLDDEFEIKGSEVYVIGNQGPFSVRIRHGVGSVVMNNPGCWNVSSRCGPHFIGNMPKAKVVLYSGNLDGRKGHWEPNSGAPDAHSPGGGHNMQCAVETSVIGVNEVVHGFHFGDNDKKYAPIGCIIDPALRDKTKIVAGKPLFEAVKAPQFGAVKALETLQARRTRDVAEAAPDERNREDEVYEWYTECVANSLKQAA